MNKQEVQEAVVNGQGVKILLDEGIKISKEDFMKESTKGKLGIIFDIARMRIQSELKRPELKALDIGNVLPSMLTNIDALHEAAKIIEETPSGKQLASILATLVTVYAVQPYKILEIRSLLNLWMEHELRA